MEDIKIIKQDLEEIKKILKKIMDDSDKEDIVNISEACKITNLSSSTIYNLKHKELIPYHKRPGSNKLLFSRKELQSWMLKETNDKPLYKSINGRVAIKK